MTPVLDTPRLIVRAHRPDDFDAYCALWADPDVVRFIGGAVFSREACWSRFLRHAGHWHHLGFGFLAVEDRETGRFVGEAGFHEMRRELAPSIEGTLEAGWALMPAFHGHGYGFEAMRALVGWADEAFPGRRMTAIIEPDNAPSIRVARRLGFSAFADTVYHGVPVTLFERPPAE
ncbi:MAG: GNAT family N-acetyltransferase [Rhizobiaceae bacterium]|nr:GNAT family N-acetyltransferase [Rhizobiaceae bacterium]